MNGRRGVRGWGASGCSNLTWSGRARDVTKKAQLVASAGEPEVLKVRLAVRSPLATTHPV